MNHYYNLTVAGIKNKNIPRELMTCRALYHSKADVGRFFIARIPGSMNPNCPTKQQIFD